MCEGAARNTIMDLDAERVSSDDMLHVLETRFGINMSRTDVLNKLAEIKRKPGEELHSLHDRVMSLARRADLGEGKRRQVTRNAFFTALRSNRELQHWVGKRDNGDDPNIDVTLALALQYEMDHGREETSVKQVTCTTDGDSDAESTTTEVSEQVNKLSFTSMRDVKDPVLKKMGQTQNDIIELLKKQSELLTSKLNDSGVSAASTPKKKYDSNRSSSYKSDNHQKPKWKPKNGADSTPKGKSDYKNKDKKWKDKKNKGKNGWKEKSKVHQTNDDQEREESEPDERQSSDSESARESETEE